jgi:TolB-like protein/Tfp pilus assembly protein PilF
MSEPSKAVFLSYASQDAEAAKRICDALRAAGVEVWFDQSELVGGDAWDAKIRKQIKECALLIPIISANTQQRTEGYFRLEWRLADQRTHLMAKGRAFLLPVVIDDTRDADAHVPDSFTEVQWTRLPGGETNAAFCARVKKLLGGSLEIEAGHPRSAEYGEVAAPPKKANPPWLTAVIVVVPVLVGLALAWRVLPHGGGALGEDKSTVPALPAVAPAIRDWPKDPELKRAIALTEGLESIPDDLALAEQIVKPILERAPADVEAVTVMARVQTHFLRRGFDRSDERSTQARLYAERALQLGPDEPEAMYAVATYLFSRAIDLPRTERLLRRAMELDPGNPRPGRLLADLFNATNRPTEALAQGKDNVRRFPHDVLSHYDLARTFKDQGRYEEFDRELDATLAIGPLPNAIVWKARLLFGLHNDFPGMKTWLDRVPERVRGTERAVFGYFLYAAFGGQPETGLEALRGFPQKWFTDFEYAGPTALLNASLFELQGKVELARQQYETALAEIQRMRAADPGRIGLSSVEFWTLLGLGRKGEARASYRRMIEGTRRPYAQSLVTGWWYSAIPAALLLGERATALELLRESIVTLPESRVAYRLRFQIDPRMAPFRDDPEITALLAEPRITKATEGGPAATQVTEDGRQGPVIAVTAVDPKSVAVLAFANLSDDKANEYFSDGISEELLNVLAKIPGLKVTARTSSFHFKGTNTAIPEIAQQLGVAYVVEGSVRKQGDKVRITAQLIKAADDFHVWSDTFTRDLKDIFAVQDEIAGLIAKNLELKMGMVAARPTIDLEAYQEYLTGRALFAKASNDDLKAAVGHFEKALAIEPKLTAAWVQLASVHTQLGRWGGTPTLQAWIAARAAIDRAIALEPDSPDVLLALGWILRTADWDWRGAERAYRRALELRPNHPDTLSAAAVLLFNLGRKEEALNLGRQAVQLDPLNAATQIDLSLVFYFSREWAEQEKLTRRAIQLAPTGVSYHELLAFSLAEQQRFAEAEAEARGDPDDVGRFNALGIITALQGQGEAARGYRRQMEELSQARGDTADLQLGIADISCILGDKDRAFAALGKAVSTRDPSVSWFRNDFYLQPLHSDPRWDALLHKVGLADDQLK